jgi:pyruvate dehydrogenase E2 component (dihydrolipoamide acetyltransferase)
VSLAVLDLRCQVPLHVVELNQLLGEVQTGKATIEMPSQCSGIVRRLPAQPGELVRVGDPLVTFEVENEGGPGLVGGIPREEAPTRRVRLRPPRQTQ